MNEAIQKALEALAQANISGYFEEMDKITPSHKLTELNTLRSMFTLDRYDQSYYQKLEVFAHHITDAPHQELDKEKEGSTNINNEGANIKNQFINPDFRNSTNNF